MFGPFDMNLLTDKQKSTELQVPLILDNDSYKVRITGSFYGSHQIGDRVETGTINSGLNLLKCPSDELTNIVNYIESRFGKVEECGGQFCIPCTSLNNTDSLAITVDDFNLYVPFSDIWHQGDQYCTLKMEANNELEWELGTPFLEQYVTLINIDDEKVSFYGEQI